jgi:hypothetical protein
MEKLLMADKIEKIFIHQLKNQANRIELAENNQ